MKISKIAIVVLLAAGFLTTSASASMATDCLDGSYVDVGVNATCPPVDGAAEVKPIDSCWTSEDGTVQACARGGLEPMPANGEDTPVDSAECDLEAIGLVDAEGKTPEQCAYEAVPYEVSGEEGEGLPLEEGTVDETLMYQSGIAESGAMPNNQNASNTLAAFGVLVGALGAFGIAISRERAAK